MAAPPPSSAGGPARSTASGLGLSAVALIGSGLLLNLFLAIVARSVTPAEYALFSTFWSIALLAGFGVFLPIEQWLAERRPSAGELPGVVLSAARVVFGLVLVELVVVLGVGGTVLWSLGGGGWTIAALAALCVASGAQFLARGALIGRERLDLFSGVLLLDVGLRVALAAAFGAAGVGTTGPYAWAVVAAICLAHTPVLVAIAVGGRSDGGVRTFTGPRPLRPVMALLVGSLGAQLLFNGPAIVLAATSADAELPEVAAFLAAFQLVRIPLFLAIPLQATLIPVVGRLLRDSDARQRAAWTVRLSTGAAVLMVVAALTGWTLGPTLVRLVFGSEYDASSGLMCVLAAGTGAYLGLLVLSQVFVADGRHRVVGVAWGSGALAATAAFLVVPSGPQGAATAFTVGCVVGLAWALAALWIGDRGSRPAAV